jgi:hypothetical protein
VGKVRSAPSISHSYFFLTHAFYALYLSISLLSLLSFDVCLLRSRTTARTDRQKSKSDPDNSPQCTITFSPSVAIRLTSVSILSCIKYRKYFFLFVSDHSEVAWTLRSVGEYRGEVPHAAAFSPDGSLFAISFGPVLLSLSFSLSLYVSLLLSLSVSASHAATGSDSVGSVHARLQGPPHLHLSHRPHPVLPSTSPVAHYPQRNFADFAGRWGSRRSRPTWWPAAENTLSYGICYLCASGGAFTSARASSPSTPSRPPSPSSPVRLH